jgi:BlaI family transcriptional regulator, penicillinase repressor
MKNIPSIPESEWKVMQLLWEKSPLAAYDIHQALKESEGWHRNTINTRLRRLEKKGVIRSEKYKNLYMYHPLVTEEECIDSESQCFLQRVFGGAVKPMLVHFAKKQQLSPKEVKELKRILDGKEI